MRGLKSKSRFFESQSKISSDEHHSKHNRTISSPYDAQTNDEPAIALPPRPIDLAVAQELLTPGINDSAKPESQIADDLADEDGPSPFRQLYRGIAGHTTRHSTSVPREEDDFDQLSHDRRSWVSLCDHIFSIGPAVNQDRSSFVLQYDELAKEHGLAPCTLRRPKASQRSEDDSGSSPIAAVKRSWLSRKFGRKSSTSSSSRQRRSIGRRVSFGDVTYFPSRRRDSLKDLDLDEVARLTGLNLIKLPPQFAPNDLALPTCLSATGSYLAQHGPVTPGIFRISGSSTSVTALYDYFSHQYSDAEKERNFVHRTVRHGHLPDMSLNVHDIASVFKKLLSGIPGGILGSVELFIMLRDIMMHSSSQIGSISPETSGLTCRLTALAMACSQPNVRLSLICAVFGLLSLIANHSQKVQAEENEATEQLAAKSELMSTQALGVIFGPLLLGDKIDQIPIGPSPSEQQYVGPLKKRSRYRKSSAEKAEEKETAFALQLYRAKLVVDVTQTIIADWVGVVEQLRFLGVSKDATSQASYASGSNKSTTSLERFNPSQVPSSTKNISIMKKSRSADLLSGSKALSRPAKVLGDLHEPMTSKASEENNLAQETYDEESESDFVRSASKMMGPNPGLQSSPFGQHGDTTDIYESLDKNHATPPLATERNENAARESAQASIPREASHTIRPDLVPPRTNEVQVHSNVGVAPYDPQNEEAKKESDPDQPLSQADRQDGKVGETQKDVLGSTQSNLSGSAPDTSFKADESEKKQKSPTRLQRSPQKVHRRFKSVPSSMFGQASHEKHGVGEDASGNVGKISPRSKQRMSAGHIKKRYSGDFFSRENTSPQESALSPTDSSTTNKTLYAEIRRLQRRVEQKIEENRQLRHELDAMRQSKDTATLTEQLHSSQRDIRVWRNRAEWAEKKLVMQDQGLKKSPFATGNISPPSRYQSQEGNRNSIP